ncbi:helix-turn-helix domain-containing protein [Facklamia miroungae]|uniref:Helix-turn-helix n=1 Tax=Facklamia miroungae TaxID=120956 RepID=A0A1G7NYM2_9LACT|nr:helix-turn-helix transcriptional regulator [Facklamia miroungae]NKZ28515.1 helix-turn-helix transcriptional regulator [Facklamia miroungae]SDF79061.1 Helix-turn-helix [Facklamia miroungae]
MDRLKELIKKDGRSLYQIAKSSGLAYSLIHNVVNGKTKNTIQLDTAFKLADALGVDVNEFREEKEDE